MSYIAKVRQDEDGPWQYVDEANCATEKQCHARRFRDRKIAKELALEYECEYKIVRLIPRGWKGGQVVLTKEDESAAYAFSGEDGIELNEYELVILAAHFARQRIALAARATTPASPVLPVHEPSKEEGAVLSDRDLLFVYDGAVAMGIDGAAENARATILARFREVRAELAASERSVRRAETYLLRAKEDRKKRIAAHVAKAAREGKKRKSALTDMQRSIGKWKARSEGLEAALAALAKWERAYDGLASEVDTKKRELAASEKECAAMRRVVERARVVAAERSIYSESSYEEMEEALDELDAIHPPLPDERDEEIANLRRTLTSAVDLVTTLRPIVEMVKASGQAREAWRVEQDPVERGNKQHAMWAAEHAVAAAAERLAKEVLYV